MHGLLQQVLKNAKAKHDDWVTLVQKSKSIDATTPLHGCARSEVELMGPTLFAAFASSILSHLKQIAKHSAPHKSQKHKQQFLPD